MGTPFSAIYDLFFSQATADNLLAMKQEDMEKNMELWLLSAIGYFPNCRQDLNDYDLQLSQFNIKLEMIEIQILAKFMLLSYMDTKLIKDNLLSQKLNSRDYRQYSEQGLIKAIIGINEQITNQANTLLSRYSWNLKNLKELFKND